MERGFFVDVIKLRIYWIAWVLLKTITNVLVKGRGRLDRRRENNVTTEIRMM